MEQQAKQTVEIGYASAHHIQQGYDRWVRAVGVQDTPLGRLGPTLAESYNRDELSSTMVPNFPSTLNKMLEKGPEATICSRSIVLAARVGDQVIGGLVARPQRGCIEDVGPFGRTVQAQMLVRLMKLEIVSVVLDYRRRHVATTMVRFALDVMREGQVHLVYGTFPAERNLGSFYRSLGFTVLDPGYAIDVTKATGASFGIAAEDNERLFAQRLGDGPALEIVPPGQSFTIG